jgi:O-antigen ligase
VRLVVIQMKGLKNWFVFGLATLAFLAPLKFGVPTMVQSAMVPPQGLAEWLYFSWPNELAIMFVFAVFVWLVLDRERMLARVDLLFVLPLLFLLMQALAVPGTICRQSTVDTLMLFEVCVLVFYVAAWYVRDGAATATIFGGLALAVLFVCILAMQQHFGGLQESRELAAKSMNLAQAPKDFVLRLTSDRVYGPFVYPNALAGFLVVAFAPTLAWIWVRARGWDARVKWLALAFTGGVMIFCLMLTGSRGGLVSFGVMALAVLRCLVPKDGRRAVTAVVVLVLALGAVAVLGRQGGFLHFGTKSLEARTDYWRGAIAIIKDHPWVGTGPGTFGSIYPKYKTATTEEAQAVHNSFLQMWSDSGVLAFIAFAALWLVAVRDSLRLARERVGDVAAAAVCGALAGWSIHGLVDFDLYVPGVALPAFILLGTVQGLKELPRTDSVTPRRRANWAVGAVCFLVLVGVLWVEGRSLTAVLIHGQARELVNVDPAAALIEARKASALAPWNPHFEAEVGDIARLAGRPTEVVAAYRDAIEDDPYRASLWWHAGQAEKAAHGINADAIQYLRRAVELNPTNSRYNQALADAEESVRQSPPALLESLPAKDTGSSN